MDVDVSVDWLTCPISKGSKLEKRLIEDIRLH